MPGEEVEVQIAVKCALNENAGHWSSWSRPERAVVPQSAGELEQGFDHKGLLSCDLYCQQQQGRSDHFHSDFQMIFHCCALHLICRGSSVSGMAADMAKRQHTKLPTRRISGEATSFGDVLSIFDNSSFALLNLGCCVALNISLHVLFTLA